MFPQDKQGYTILNTQFSSVFLRPFKTAAHHKIPTQGYNESFILPGLRGENVVTISPSC